MALDFGVAVFAVALIPVVMFLGNLNKLRKCLTTDDDRAKTLRSAFFRMPIIIVIAPLFMFAMMSLENALDPEFAARSFENPEHANIGGFFMFAIDQTMKGAFFDLMESFRLDVADLEHKCDSRLFCGSILIYRLTVATAVSVLFLAVLIAFGGWFDAMKRLLTRSKKAGAER